MVVIITSLPHVTGRKIVKTIGLISVRRAEWWSEDAVKCFRKLTEEAERQGADALVNVKYEGSGLFGIYGKCEGVAVLLDFFGDSIIGK